jgi:valyl-tRNA synthetase
MLPSLRNKIFCKKYKIFCKKIWNIKKIVNINNENARFLCTRTCETDVIHQGREGQVEQGGVQPS